MSAPPTASPAQPAVNDQPRSGMAVTIGEAARRLGVSPSALRLWERQGLVRPRRTASHYRLYTEADLVQLRRVHRLRRVERVNAPGIRRLLRASPAASIEGQPALAGHLRQLRLRRGLSLRDAGAASGLSASFIGAVERGRSRASVATLQRLTAAYGTTLVELLGHETPPKRLVRPGERRVLDLDRHHVRIEQLADAASLLEPQLFVLASGASSDGSYAHDGEEFLFLLDGALRVWVGETESYRLVAGDALSFPSNLPHRWRNDAGGETRLLWINTPPTF